MADERPEYLEPIVAEPTIPGRGGDVLIRGAGFRLLGNNRPRVEFGGVEAPVVISSEDFMVAKVPEGATKEQFRLMLQNLLAERFKLKAHRETKELPIYELVVGKNGPKFKEHEGQPPPDMTPGAVMRDKNGNRIFPSNSWAMELAPEKVRWRSGGGLDILPDAGVGGKVSLVPWRSPFTAIGRSSGRIRRLCIASTPTLTT